MTRAAARCTARLTIGLVVLPGGRQEPSRDLFRFSGTLKPADLTGALQRSGTRQRIRLKLQPRGSMFAAGSYTEWKRQADEILKFRGPKW